MVDLIEAIYLYTGHSLCIPFPGGLVNKLFIQISLSAKWPFAVTVKGCTHRAMIPCNWGVDSNQKE